MAGATEGRIVSREIDLTPTRIGLGAVIAGFCVESTRGDIRKPTAIRSESQYLTTFTANERIEVGGDLAEYSVLNYLAKGNFAQVQRVAGAGIKYAAALTNADVTLHGSVAGGSSQTSSTTTHVPISEGIDDPYNYVFDPNDKSELLIYAKDAGAEGKRLGYTILDNVTDTRFKQLVVYKDGRAVETHVFSRTEGLRDGLNRNTYVPDLLERRSRYIGAIDNVAIDKDVLPANTSAIVTLGGGTNGASVTDNDRIKALQNFRSSDEYPMMIFCDGGNTTQPWQVAIKNLAEYRQDFVGILSVSFDAGDSIDPMKDAIAYRKDLGIDSSYCMLYFPHIKIYDKFNDREIWTSPDGHVAARVANTRIRGEHPWYAIAGSKRGNIDGAIDTQYHMDELEELELCANQINPIRKMSEVTQIRGQETMQIRRTRLSKGHVRFALINMRRPIAIALEDYLWDFNDVANRIIVKRMIESFMDDMVTQNAFEDYEVKCDEENNTPDDIDNDRMNVRVFVKPKGVNETIFFDTIITPNGISFSEAADLL